MHPHIVIIGVLAGMVVVGCSGSATGATAPPRSEDQSMHWSDSVITVDTLDANEHGELRVVVLDSASRLPVASAAVTLGSEQAPPSSGHASSAAILQLGRVIADVDGRLVVSALPQGYFRLTAARSGIVTSERTVSFAFSHDQKREITIIVGK